MEAGRGRAVPSSVSDQGGWVNDALSPWALPWKGQPCPWGWGVGDKWGTRKGPWCLCLFQSDSRPAHAIKAAGVAAAAPMRKAQERFFSSPTLPGSCFLVVNIIPWSPPTLHPEHWKSWWHLCMTLTERSRCLCVSARWGEMWKMVPSSQLRDRKVHIWEREMLNHRALTFRCLNPGVEATTLHKRNRDPRKFDTCVVTLTHV